MPRVLEAEPAGVLPVEPPALPEDRLQARVVPLGVEAKRDRPGVRPVVPKARESARSRHVLLGVAAVDAEREELHELARVVLVRSYFVLSADESQRIIAGSSVTPEERVRKLPNAWRRKSPVLAQHELLRADAGVRGREPVVPDEVIRSTRPRPDHPVEPPEDVVPPGVLRGDGVAVDAGPRAGQLPRGGLRSRSTASRSPSLANAATCPLGAEARTPEQPLCLACAEPTPVDRNGQRATRRLAGLALPPLVLALLQRARTWAT